MNDVTRILSRIEEGDSTAAEHLLPLIYAELRELAAVRMNAEAGDQTLQATALVHEAYIRLVDRQEPLHWNSRGHFFAAAAEAMRRILIEHARRKRTLKRGGHYQRVPLTDPAAVDETPQWDLLDLDAALQRLEAAEPKTAELVKLRYFAGLSLADTAAVMGISTATAKRYWVYARAWLFGELRDEPTA